jgi:hypothetical protein
MPGEVDLHGLYVKEAITYTDQNIAEARARGNKEIHLIVGSYKYFLYLRRERTDLLAQARASTLRITRQSSNQPLRSSCRSKTRTIYAAYLVSYPRVVLGIIFLRQSTLKTRAS